MSADFHCWVAKQRSRVAYFHVHLGDSCCSTIGCNGLGKSCVLNLVRKISMSVSDRFPMRYVICKIAYK
jgi:hypothetical protein